MKILKTFILAFFVLALASCASGEKMTGQKDSHFHNNHHIVKKTKKCRKVSINKATVNQLMTIHGINKTRAENLDKYRKEHGDFKSIADLKHVKGFNKKIMNKIKRCVTL